MSTAPVRIESPCVKVCVLDRESGFCIGCLRTGDEIGAWLAMGSEARAEVMAALPARAARLGPDARRRRAAGKG